MRTYIERIEHLRGVCISTESEGDRLNVTHPESGAEVQVAGYGQEGNIREALAAMHDHLWPHLRPYDNSGVASLRGKESGRTALLVGGGLSGTKWYSLWLQLRERDGLAPVVIALNGCNQDPECRARIDYSVLLECDPPLPDWQWIPQPDAVVLMNYRLGVETWAGGAEYANFVKYRDNPANYAELILAERSNGDYGPPEDNCRETRGGLWYGPWGGVPGIPPLGTSFSQMLHLAALLGCTEAHSAGVDLCIRDDDRHHWYAEEKYNTPGGRKPSWPEIEFAGLRTFQWWLDSAHFLMGLRWLFWTQGFRWYDHSGGLLQKVGM